MALSTIQSKYAANGFTNVQFDSNVTQGSTIAVYLCSNASLGSITVSDSVGSTYTAKTNEQSSDTGRYGRWYYAYNVAGGTRITVTPSSVGIGDIDIIEIGGFLSTGDPFDKEAVNAPASTTTPTLASNITPSVDNCIILSAITGGGTTTCTPGSTTIDNQFNASFSLCTQYTVQTTATAYNPTWTLGASRSCPVNAIVFKPLISSQTDDKAYFL